MTHALTILTNADTPKKRAAKLFRRGPSGLIEHEDYEDGALFWTVRQQSVESFADMCAKVSALQDERHSIIILGQPKPGVDLTQPHRRLKKDRRNKKGEVISAAFEDGMAQILPIDLDAVHADHLDVIGDPGGAIQYAIDELVQYAPELEGASCLAIFSSSAAVFDNTAAKLRLYYWLARPYPLADLNRWGQQVNARATANAVAVGGKKKKVVDFVIYQAVQPIFVARPFFENMPDPLPGDRRWAVIEGYSEAVELVIDADTPRTPGVKVGAGLRMHMGGGIERHLAEIGGERGLREPARSAIGAAIRQRGSVRAEQERDAIIARVADALRNADPGHRSPETVQGYIDGLDAIFDWTLDAERAEEAARVIMPIERDTRPRRPLDQARKALREMVRDTADQLLSVGWILDEDDPDAEPEPAAHVNATLGVGKTDAAIHTALDLYERGNGATAIGSPTHKLNKEIRDRARAVAAERGSDARIAMQLGREAIDPDGGGNATMCTQLDTINDLKAAGISDFQSYACRREVTLPDGKGGKVRRVYECPDFNTCRFQENQKEVKAADIVLVSHAALTHPGAKQYAFVIVDENPVPAFLRGCGGKQEQPRDWITVTPADMSTEVLTKAGATHRDKTIGLELDYPELVNVRRAMPLVAKASGRGTVSRKALIECDLTADLLDAAADQAKGQQKGAPRELVPGMDPRDRRDLLKHTAANAALRREMRLYRLLAEFLRHEELGERCGWVRWTTKKAEGQRHDVWRLTYTGKVAKQYRAPTALLDATMRTDFKAALRVLFPGLRDDMGGEVLASSPHRKVRVQKTASWVLNQLEDPHGVPKEERGIVPREKAREAQAVALREVRALGGGQAVVVANKVIADSINENPVAGVEAVHFAVVRGLDKYRRARYQATFGRTQPSPESVETMAGAITGKAVEPLGEKVWYPSVERAILGRDGSVLGYQTVPRHRDALAEACRWQIAEAALIQSERLRGVERDETTPALWDLVGCPVPDGLEVDEVVDYQPPNAVDLMLALGGRALLNPAHAVAAFPELWPVVPQPGETDAEAKTRTVEAAKWDLRGGSSGVSFNKASIKGNSLTSTEYQLEGQGQRPSVVIGQPGDEATRAWLESRLGRAVAWLGKPPAAKARKPAAERQVEPEAVSVPPAAPSPPAAPGTPLPPITGRVDVVLAGAVAVTLPPPRLHCAVNVTLDDVRVRACGTVAPQPEPPLPPIKANLVATLDDVRVSACGTVAPMPDPLPPLPAGPGSTAAWARLACSPCSHPPVRVLACVVSEVARPPYPGRGGSPEAWRAYIFGPDALPPPPKPRVPGAVAPLDEWPLHWCPDCEREGHDKPDLYAITVKGRTTVWRCNRHDTHGVFEPPHIGDPGYPVKKANQ